MKALYLLLSLLCFNLQAAISVTDGSQGDTQAKINAAANGDIVIVTNGTFNWGSGAISIVGKGITLKGLGGARIIGRSTSSVLIGVGAKTFTTQAGLPIVNGQTLDIEKLGGETDSGTGAGTGNRPRMTGTVTSYSGTTLVMNITSTAVAGTFSVWVIRTTPVTTVTFTGGTSTPMMSVTEWSSSSNVTISDIAFKWNTTGTGDRYQMQLNHNPTGNPIIIRDCYFELDGGAGFGNILDQCNRGLIHRCSFDSMSFARAGTYIKFQGPDNTAWSTTSTFGTADTDGTHQVYVEDCEFVAIQNAWDTDNSAKVVIRHCTVDNAGASSHGADTSFQGVRHYELYNNTFLFNDVGSLSMNINWWWLLRGGTGVITDNAFDDINSGWWGNKNEIILMVFNLDAHGGPYPCWGANTGAIDWPAPRQIGRGYVQGTNTTDAYAYVGDPEPLYIWNNTGTLVIGKDDGNGGDSGVHCTSPDDFNDYLVLNRDYFLSAKPAYTKYTYPHPLVAGSSSPQVPSVPEHLRLSLGPVKLRLK